MSMQSVARDGGGGPEVPYLDICVRVTMDEVQAVRQRHPRQAEKVALDGGNSGAVTSVDLCEAGQCLTSRQP